MCTWCDWFWFCISLVEKLVKDFKATHYYYQYFPKSSKNCSLSQSRKTKAIGKRYEVSVLQRHLFEINKFLINILTMLQHMLFLLETLACHPDNEVPSRMKEQSFWHKIMGIFELVIWLFNYLACRKAKFSTKFQKILVKEQKTKV